MSNSPNRHRLLVFGVCAALMLLSCAWILFDIRKDGDIPQSITNTPTPPVVKLPTVKEEHKPKVTKKEVGEWLSFAPSYFRECMKRKSSTQREISSLPKLAIVVSLSRRVIGTREYEVITNNHKCYSKKHGYDYHLNILEDNVSKELFMRERHKKLLDFLPKYQWILHLDLDSVFINMNHSLDRFISGDQDLGIAIRENGEIIANYFVKNSDFGECFLEETYNFHKTRPGLNLDNGEIIQMFMDFTNPQKSAECEKLRNSNYEAFVDCFDEHFLLQYFRYLHGNIPIRVDWPRAGWWRTLMRDTPFFSTCWSNDIIGHGDKLFSSWLLKNNDYSDCSKAPDLIPNCKFATPQEEMDLAKTMCVWSYPNCMKGGMNICLIDNPKCTKRVLRMAIADRYGNYRETNA